MTKQLLSYTSIFAAIFLAELADKTQIAAFTFAASGAHSRLAVFLVASLALVCSTALAVFLAGAIGPVIAKYPVEKIAGVIFIVMGAWMILRSS